MDKTAIKKYISLSKVIKANWGIISNQNGLVELKATNNDTLISMIYTSNNNAKWEFGISKKTIKLLSLYVDKENKFENRNSELYFNGFLLPTLNKNDYPQIKLGKINKSVLLPASKIKFAIDNALMFKPDDNNLYSDGIYLKNKEDKIEIVATNRTTLLTVGEHIENPTFTNFMQTNTVKLLKKILKDGLITIADYGNFIKYQYNNYYIITPFYDVKYPLYKEGVLNEKTIFEFNLSNRIISLLAKLKDAPILQIMKNEVILKSNTINEIKEEFNNNLNIILYLTHQSNEFFRLALKNNINHFYVGNSIIKGCNNKINIYGALNGVEVLK